MNNKKVESLISLSQKAGKLKAGEFLCEASVKNGSAKLVILSKETAKNTTKKFTDKTGFYKIPFITLDISKAELGALVGKQERSVVSILDEGFAEKILTHINNVDDLDILI